MLGISVRRHERGGFGAAMQVTRPGCQMSVVLEAVVHSAEPACPYCKDSPTAQWPESLTPLL